MDFFPAKKQTEEYLKSVFIEKGLAEVVKLHKAQASQEAKRELTRVEFEFNYFVSFFLYIYKTTKKKCKHFRNFRHLRKVILSSYCV